MTTVYLISFFVGILSVIAVAVTGRVFDGRRSAAAGKETGAGRHGIENGGHKAKAAGDDAAADGRDIDVTGPDGDFDTDVSGQGTAITDATHRLLSVLPTALSIFAAGFGGCGWLARLIFPQPYIHIPIAALSSLGLAAFLLLKKQAQGGRWKM